MILEMRRQHRLASWTAEVRAFLVIRGGFHHSAAYVAAIRSGRHIPSHDLLHEIGAHTRMVQGLPSLENKVKTSDRGSSKVCSRKLIHPERQSMKPLRLQHLRARTGEKASEHGISNEEWRSFLAR
jgi:hypothetical protein